MSEVKRPRQPAVRRGVIERSGRTADRPPPSPRPQWQGLFREPDLPPVEEDEEG